MRDRVKYFRELITNLESQTEISCDISKSFSKVSESKTRPSKVDIKKFLKNTGEYNFQHICQDASISQFEMDQLIKEFKSIPELYNSEREWSKYDEEILID